MLNLLLMNGFLDVETSLYFSFLYIGFHTRRKVLHLLLAEFCPRTLLTVLRCVDREVRIKRRKAAASSFQVSVLHWVASQLINFCLQGPLL